MMKLTLRINGAFAELVEEEGLLTTGMVGAAVAFQYDEAWNGLRKTAVFRGSGITVDVLDVDSTATIPVQVLAQPGLLSIGIEGRNADGTVVIPTVWVDGIYVHAGANASGDSSTDPTLPVWGQLQNTVGDVSDLATTAKDNLVAAVNEVLSKVGGDIDPAVIEQAVLDYLAENPVEVEIPKTLPNPYPLVIGDTTYDGSASVKVEIPSGGGGATSNKTKIITVANITATEEIVIGQGDDDTLSFGDAVVQWRHFFYKTSEGEQLRAKKIFGYFYVPSEVTIPNTLCFSAYYADGNPTSWNYGDFNGSNKGFIEFLSASVKIGAGQYYAFVGTADYKLIAYGTTGMLGWNRLKQDAISYNGITETFPHISGLKIFNASATAPITFPIGTQFVLKAEVDDNA